jgi:hypothetical protein
MRTYMAILELRAHLALVQAIASSRGQLAIADVNDAVCICLIAVFVAGV